MTTRRTRTARPAADCGHHVRTLRKAAGLLHREIADQAKMRVAQVSQVEQGHNVEIQYYARIAKVLGFRGALELFRTPDSDPLARHRDRAWALLDERQKKRVLRTMNNILIEG